MKKILSIFLLSLIFLVGCNNTMGTPTNKVEEYLGKYQKLDKKVLTELDEVLDKDTSMSDVQKKEYRLLLEKQYQNLSYKIKNEDVEGDTATVDVEIEVLDYQTAINKAKEYYAANKDQFENKKDDNSNNNNDNNDNNNDNVVEKVEEKTKEIIDDAEDAIENISSFIDYKLKELKTVSNTTKYDLTFNLTKQDGEWVIDELSDTDREKLHGLY